MVRPGRGRVDGSGSFADFGGYAAWKRAEDVWSRWEQTVQDVRRDWVRLSRRQFADRWDRYSIRDFLRSRGWSEAAVEEYGIVTFTESTLGTSVLQEFRETLLQRLRRCRADRRRPWTSCLANSRSHSATVSSWVTRSSGSSMDRTAWRSRRVRPGDAPSSRADLVVCTCRSPFSALSTWSGRSVRANDGRSDSCTTTPRRRSTSSSGDRRGVGRSGQLVVRSRRPPRSGGRTTPPAGPACGSPPAARELHVGSGRAAVGSASGGRQTPTRGARPRAVPPRNRIRGRGSGVPRVGPTTGSRWGRTRSASRARPVSSWRTSCDPKVACCSRANTARIFPAWIEGAVESAQSAVATVLPRVPSGARASWLES